MTTDHYPVITEIRLPHEKKHVMKVKNFRATDWDKFREDLKERTTNIPEGDDIISKAEFDRRQGSDGGNNKTIKEIVPVSMIPKFLLNTGG